MKVVLTNLLKCVLASSYKERLTMICLASFATIDNTRLKTDLTHQLGL
jgi:hypothetical protein